MRYPPDTGSDPETRRLERDGAEAVKRILANQGRSFEAECSNCGDQFMAPPWEDPEDTLCVPCAEEEQNS